MKKILRAGFTMAFLLALGTAAQADVITFTAGQYDNTKNTVTAGPTTNYLQTTGEFRDIIWWSINNGAPRVGSPDYINQGFAMTTCGIAACAGTSGFTALNFSGPAVNGGQSYLSIYDTTPGDGTATRNLFDATGGLTISADVLFTPGQHVDWGGVVALYSEGQDALALLLNNGGGSNADVPTLSLVFQSLGLGTTLASVSLNPDGGGGGLPFLADTWYRVTLNLNVTGPDSFTATGTFQNHADGTNPNSALGSTIATLNFGGSLSSPGNALDLTNPGEIGLMAMGNNIGGAGCAPPAAGGTVCTDNIGVSITNFSAPTRVPEPASLLLLGIGLAGVVGFMRKGKK